MNESPPSSTDSLDHTSTVTSAQDRRSTARVDCHTVVTVITLSPDGAGEQRQVLKAYSEDVSLSGARLISPVPIPGDRLFLRFLLPTFGNRFVEARIVSRSERQRQALKSRARPQHVYGVRFTGAIAEAADFPGLTIP